MVDTCLVGSKDIFAIEFYITESLPKPMGIVRVWLGGEYIGTLEDVNFLSVTLHQLERISLNELFCEDLEGLKPQEAYCLIKSGVIDNSEKFFLSMGESFDDFSVVLYGCQNNLVFIWELNDNQFFDYPQYSSGVKFAKVSFDYFVSIVKEFKCLLA